jgi:hypothetical protein
MKRTISLIILTVFALTVFFSCDKDSGPYIIEIPNEEGTNNDTTTTPTVPDPTVFSYSISYGSDIKPLLQQNCVQSCHNSQHPKLDLRPQVSYDQLLTDGFSAPYVDIINPNQSLLYLHLAGIYTLMPQGGPQLSQGKIDSVYTWISQ